ncbi:MAG TPA: PKD domain-containing protein, partial [Xanthomonadales bacterium]|nr:PKD domain-containing protein [Xanthomonadales bacterium]
ALSPSIAFAQVPPPPPAAGFPNIARTPGQLLSPLMAPSQGRTAIIAFHNNILVTIPEVPSSEPGSDFQVRTWNITNPAAPIELAQLGVTPMPVMAHGYYFVHRAAGSYLAIGADSCGGGCPWSFRANAGVAGLVREASGTNNYGVRGDLTQPWFITPSYWSYNAIGGNVQIIRGEPSDPGALLGTFDHLGLTGVIGHPFLLGNILYYVSDQSRTGIAAYDISNPQAVVLLDVLTTGGPGGYWPELWAGEGRLYAVMPYQTEGNGVRIADITDPTDLRFVDDVPLPGDPAMYAQFQDEFGFIGQYKLDMRTRRPILEFEAPAAQQPLDTSQFALPLGNLLVTGGIGEGQGMAIWAHQAAPDTRAPEVSYHIPRAGQASYPRTAPISLIVHETLDMLSVNPNNVRVCANACPASGGGVAAAITLAFDDVITITPNAQLLANQTYEVRVDNLRDAAGNVMPLPYRFTFATGAAVNGNLPPVVSAFNAAPYPAAPAANVSFAATATDPNAGDTLQYRFDFGDGTPQTAWGATTNATHAYATAGHYRATVQVKDPSNVVATRGTVVTVLAASAAAPTRSSSIACHAPGRRAWAANPDADTIAEIDMDTLAVVREIAVCDDPRAVARSGQGEIWVACSDGDAIAVVNGTTGVVAATLPTGYGSSPQGVAISPDGLTAYVTLNAQGTGTGSLRRYATATRTQTGQLALGPNPRAIAVSADGSRALVTRFLSANDYAEVWDVNTAGGMSLTRAIRVNKFGGDANRDTTAAGKGVANQLAGIAFNPLDGRAWFAANKPNNEKGPLIVPTLDIDSDNTVRDLVVQIDPNGATVADRVVRAVDLDNSDSASAVALSPLGDYLLVALQGNDELLVLDTLASSGSTGLGGLVARIAAGGAPQGVCVDATTGRTFVQDLMGRSVTALDTNALFTTGSLAVPSTEIDTVATEPLPPNVLAGKRIFYRSSDPRMSPEGYLSCATCHLDGSHDGRTWDFTGRGEGLRNTVTLVGRGGMAHGNVHWSANFDEIQDFESDIRLFFGGNGFMSDGDYAATAAPLGPPKAGFSAPLDALAAYVASLGPDTVPRSPFRNADGSFTAQAVAGQAVFAARGCPTCHTAPRFTDSTVGAGTLRNVGTLRETSGLRLGGPLTGIDTPTLFGLWQTAPYFHDGSAATLADVFRVAGGTRLRGEDGAISGPASIENNFVDLNNDDTVRGRAYVQLDQNLGRVTFTGVNGGPGGSGTVEVRYSNSTFNPSLRLIVNGATVATVPVPDVGNDPFFRSTNWATLRFENVPLNAGATNTVALEATGYYVAVDEIVVSNAANLAAASAHRTVLAAPVGDQNALTAYLLQLDRPPPPPADTLFTNGFE